MSKSKNKQDVPGQYGGKVKRVIHLGDGSRLLPGDIVTPDQAEKWPLSNRLALAGAGKIDWYPEPVNFDGQEEGKSTASRRKKVKTKKE